MSHLIFFPGFRSAGFSGAGEWFGEFWQRILEAWQPGQTPAVEVRVVAVLVVVTFLVVPLLYGAVRHVGTAVHEAGHLVVAAVTGRQLVGVRLHSDSSGVMLSRGRGRGVGVAVTLFAGYPAPLLVGAVGVAAVMRGRAGVLLVLLGLVMLGVLLFVRNLFGLVVVLAFLGFEVLVFSWQSAGLLNAVGLVLALLLLGLGVDGLRDLWFSVQARRQQNDASLLAQAVGFSPQFWAVVFSLLAVLAVSWSLWELFFNSSSVSI